MDFELDHSFGFAMRDDSASSRSDALWQNLAAAAGWTGQETASPDDVARLINTRASAVSAPADLYRRLTELAESAAGPEPGDNPARFSDLLRLIAPDILAAALRSEEKITQRKRTLQRWFMQVSPSAILLLGKAAAYAYARPLSPVLQALLDKLAREAEELTGHVRVAADHAYRDLFRNIVDAWSEKSLDMTSSGYETMFTEHAQHAEPAADAGSVAPEPQRVVELAFESGAMGNVVWTALGHMGETQQGTRRILDMIKRAPRESRAALLVAQQFANPVRLGNLLHEDPVDFEAVDALLTHMGDGAAQALLDAVVEAKSRDTRRGLLDRLVGIGSGIGPLVAERLKSDERWYVQRNMLTVLREANCALDQVPVEKYTAHADARVRREATQLLFMNPLERDRALAAALRDSDVNMLKIGLKAARGSMPEAVVPILAKRVVDPQFPPEFRTSALQLLSRSSSMLALEALLRFAMGGTSLLGKPKLAGKSPEMLIALSGLARTWPNERRATVLLALARESKDADIVKAAAPGHRGPFVSEERDDLDDE